MSSAVPKRHSVAQRKHQDSISRVERDSVYLVASSKKDSITITKNKYARASRTTFDVPSAKAKSSRLASLTHSSANSRQSLAWRLSKKGFKTPKYQNTFRLEPYTRFPGQISDYMLAQHMHETFKDYRYDPETCIQATRNATADLRDRLMKAQYDRVKYVIVITLVEKTYQSIVSSHGRLWDPQRDIFSVYVFEGQTFYAAGMLVTLYYE